MRIRTVKPEWLSDELLAAASDEARVLSVGLILMADDEGRGRGSIAAIVAEVWRFEAAREDGAKAREVYTKARRALAELSAIGWVALYEVSGQSYFSIRTFTKHQKIDKPTKSKIPAPCEDSPSPSRAIAESSPRASRSLAEDYTTDQDQEGIRKGPGGEGIRERATVAELASALTRNDPKPSDGSTSQAHAMAIAMCRTFKDLTKRAWTHEPDLLEALSGRGALVRSPMPDIVRQMVAHLSSEPEPIQAARRAMEAWAADPWVKANRFPMAHLAKDPLKYLSKPIATNAAAPSDFSHVNDSDPLPFD